MFRTYQYACVDFLRLYECMRQHLWREYPEVLRKCGRCHKLNRCEYRATDIRVDAEKVRLDHLLLRTREWRDLGPSEPVQWRVRQGECTLVTTSMADEV